MNLSGSLPPSIPPRPRWLKSMAILFGVGILIALVLGIGWLDVPKSHADPFHRAVANADRIVVRDGGFDCCGSVDNEAVLFEVTDPQEIKEVLDNITFTSTGEECKCCGFPGIDWYQGGKRIALTAMQHGQAIRVARGGDSRLSDQSRQWLLAWLAQHGVSEEEVKHGCGGPRRDLRERATKVAKAQACANRAKAFADQNELDKAIASYTEGVNLEECYACAYYGRALAYERKGQLDAAIKDYTEAIRCETPYYKISAFTREKLAKDIDAIIGLGPNLATAYYRRGVAYMKTGERTKAESDFLKAKELGYKE